MPDVAVAYACRTTRCAAMLRAITPVLGGEALTPWPCGGGMCPVFLGYASCAGHVLLDRAPPAESVG